MQALIFANFFVFLIVSSVCIFTGLDLKKWSSWLLGLYGFLSGLLMGFLWPDGDLDVPSLLTVGALFAFIVLYGGATTHWHRQRFGKFDIDSWLLRYDQGENPSLLVRVIKKLRNK